MVTPAAGGVRGGNVVFLETAGHAQFVIAEGIDREATCIAQTAEALDEYLHLTGKLCLSARDFSDKAGLSSYGRDLLLSTAKLAFELETHIGSRYSPARISGPGILSGQIYSLQYMVCAVANRLLMAMQQLERLKPERLTLLPSPLDNLFSQEGYAENPWNVAIESFCLATGCKCIRISNARFGGDTTTPRRIDAAINFFSRVRRRINRGFFPSKRVMHSPPRDLDCRMNSLRLLFPLSPPNSLGRFVPATPGFDWGPVCGALSRGNTNLFAAEQELSVGAASWSRSFTSRVRRLYDWGSTLELELPPAKSSDDQNSAIAGSFYESVKLMRASSHGPILPFLGTDLFEPLAANILNVAIHSLSIARRTDVYAELVLDHLRPQALCTYAVAVLSDKRLSYHAQQRGIPVVCYQHGFGYGIQDIPKDHFIDAHVADYFLAYGEGSYPWVTPIVPAKAHYVAMGSTRLDRVKHRREKQKPLCNVLLVGEYSSRNTVGDQQVEDTQRYITEISCLERLAENKRLKTIYRPYIGLTEFDGTSKWIRRRGLSNIVIDVTTKFDDLLYNADLVILFTSSPVTWAEALVAGKLMIVYCEPERTRFSGNFLEDIGKVSLLCKSEDELLKSISDLCDGSLDSNNFFVSDSDRSRFMRNYLVSEGDCTNRVIRFLVDVCRSRHDDS